VRSIAACGVEAASRVATRWDRRQKFEPNHFRSLGIEPTERKILVCKAEMQHRAGFEIVARTFIDVDAPGLATQALARLPSRGFVVPCFR
jgi:microcystin degradation protein MlrC